MSILLESYNSPWLTVKNRVVMSAMTRGFAADKLCTGAITDYYVRRAKGGIGLILSEGIAVSQSGNGYNNVPFLETDEQAASWTAATRQVHQYDSRIFAQLWHCGRISHKDFTGGLDPVSSSAIQAEGVNRQNGQEFGLPRALEPHEFPAIVHQYVSAARRAVAAGFDGVELHFGHGYLIDQFLDSRINRRNDAYGGSVVNRCRLAIEVCEAVIQAVGAGKVMVRLSPSREMNGLYDWPDLDEMLQVLLAGLDRVGLRLLDISCANADYFRTSGRIVRMIRPFWPHVIIGGASLEIGQAEAEVTSGWLDLVTWGRSIIANPDLPLKIAAGEPLVPFDNSMRDTLD